MKIEDYIAKLPSGRKLSAVKITVLTMLWNAGTAFPRNWIGSSKILKATGQKYFDRRARELRDELGCDIETKYVEELKEHAWRLKSANMLVSNPREYLSASEKNKLFVKNGYICATCGKKIDAGVRGLQADHKIPLIRGGSHSSENWQPICNNCNVGKRRACEGCNDECKKCSWAFPEKTGLKTVLDLPPKLLDKLYQKSGGSHAKMNKLVQDLLYKAMDNC